MLDFLRAIAKVELSENDKEAIIEYMQKEIGCPDYINAIFFNRIQYLFIKHVIEINQFNLLNKKLGMDYSAQLYFNNLLYNEYLDYLDKITEDFEANNIEYSILKGFSIMDSLYRVDDLIYRRFSDTDILVSKKDVREVDKIMKKYEFVQGSVNSMGQIEAASRREIIYWGLNSHQEQLYVKFSKYAVTPYMAIDIDINTSIFEGGKNVDPISTEELLKHRQVKVNGHGKKFYALEKEYELIQLIYHFYKDTIYEIKKKMRQDYSLNKFCDIREYVLRYRNEIDWNLFADIVNTNKIGDGIYYVLLIVSDFYKDMNIDDILDKIEADKNVEIPCWEKIFNR